MDNDEVDDVRTMLETMWVVDVRNGKVGEL